jgi:hypothetical protein
MIKYRIDLIDCYETTISVSKNYHLLYYHCLYANTFIMSNVGRGFYFSKEYGL